MPTSDAGRFSDDELLALLRDASVPPESIVAEMEDAGAKAYPVASLAATRAALSSLAVDHLDAIITLPPELRSLVLDAAVTAQAVPLISALANCSDKSCVKDAKRSLHALKSRGLKVEAPKPVAAPVAAPTADASATLMSSVDGDGRRIVFLSGAVRGGYDVAQILLSDEHGVISAEMLPLGRKEYRRFMDRLAALEDMLVVETPRPYVRHLIAKALDRNARAGRPIPPTFNDAAFLLGPAVAPQQSPGRALPRPDDSGLFNRSGELLKLREFRNWQVPEPMGNALDAKLTEIESSKLYIDENARAAALRDAIRNAAEDFWRAASREIYAERLFDMAYAFNRAGRADHTSLALAAAWSFLEVSETASPFAVALFERFLPPPVAAPAQPDPGALIVQP